MIFLKKLLIFVLFIIVGQYINGAVVGTDSNKSCDLGLSDAYEEVVHRLFSGGMEFVGRKFLPPKELEESDIDFIRKRIKENPGLSTYTPNNGISLAQIGYCSDSELFFLVLSSDEKN